MNRAQTVIESSIKHIANQLNVFLKRHYKLVEDIVVVSNIVDQDGSVVSLTNNKIAVFLVNIERDTLPFKQASSSFDSRNIVGQKAVYLNLHIMFAANFSGKNYAEALKFISNTIMFFQRRPVIDQQNSPELDKEIEKLILEMENLNTHDLGTLWGSLSGKYLPSVLYKVRVIASIDAGDVIARVDGIQAPETVVGH